MQAYSRSLEVCCTNDSIFFSILEVFHPANEGLSSAISESGIQINYILVEVYSGASLARVLSMSSDIGFPNLTFYSERIKEVLFVQRISMDM